MGRGAGATLAVRRETIHVGIPVVWRPAGPGVGVVVPGIRLLYGPYVASGSDSERAQEAGRFRSLLVLQFGVRRCLVPPSRIHCVLPGSVLLVRVSHPALW